MRSLRALATVSVALSASLCPAGITNFDLFSFRYYTQFDAAQPTVPYGYAFSARLEHSDPADFTSAVVTQLGPVSPMPLDDSGELWSYFSPNYNSDAERDADFPPGTFTFTIDGGDLGLQTADREYPDTDRFTPSPPYFPEFDALQNLDPRVDNFISPSSYDVPSSVDFGHTFIAIYDSTGQFIAQGDSDANAGSFLLPANLLAPNSDFTVSLFFSSRISTNDAGFDGAYSQVGWDAVTQAPLHTIRVCGSADFNCDGDLGTDADIESFFACLAGSCPAAPCPSSADFNGDGDLGTDADIESFFRVLGGGPC